MKADETSLALLMRKAQSGDDQSYKALLHAAAAWLKRYLRRRVPPSELDDLVQDVLLALHAKRASYNPDLAFMPWLAAIARYKWLDHLRRIYRHKDEELQDNDAADDSSEDIIAARMSLERLFEKLPHAQSKAIELVRIEGYSIKEAASRCGLSESLIKVNIHRGLKKLAAIIESAD